MASIQSTEPQNSSLQLGNITANQAMWGGIIFSFVFTGLIWLLGGQFDTIELLPDTGFAWYKWKLPNPTFGTRLSAWGSYTIHQILIWD